MALIDSIIGAESGGNPNAKNPNSSATGHLSHTSVDMPEKFGTNTLIGKLLFSGSPATILWGVVSIAIDAINRVFRARARPHVFVKVGEGPPSLANRNAACPIERPRNVTWLRASTNHAIPNLVLSCSFPAARNGLRHAVSTVNLDCSVGAKTSAAISVARAKVWHCYSNLSPAIASAQVSPNFGAAVFSDFWDRLGKCHEPAKPNVSAINRWVH